ncbi:hypothetical protein [Kitasatospora sp. NPDC057223]|uniref:hypothetical protein n=1 Tax=Kitasatospora sp. NPDC057223 TaxID=3346055 RepID=UPI00363415E8
MTIRSLLRFLLVSPLLVAMSAMFALDGTLLVVLFTHDTELTRQLGEHPEAWVFAGLSPFAALMIAFCYRPNRPWGPRWKQLTIRAGILLVTAGAGVLVADLYGLQLYKDTVLADGVAMYVTTLCIAGWAVLHPRRRGYALPLAVVALGAAVAAMIRTAGGTAPALFADYATAGAGLLLAAVLCQQPWLRSRLGLPPLPEEPPAHPPYGHRPPGHRPYGYGIPRPRGFSRPDYFPARLPKPGEMWWADVPFEDISGSKERPVLVFSVLDGHMEVLKSTSQDRLDRSDHIALPVAGWDPRARHDSCLDLKLRQLPLQRLRWYMGPVPPPVWQQVTARPLRHAPAPPR